MKFTKTITLTLLSLASTALLAQSSKEATSSSGYISITKDPPKPANIKIVDGSVKFVDQNQNNAIDANEECSIEFKIQNTGIGEGMTMKLVTDKIYGNDLKFDNSISIGNLTPGSSKSLKLTIKAGMNSTLDPWIFQLLDEIVMPELDFLFAKI